MEENLPNVYFRKKPATIIFNLTSPLHQEKKKYKSEGKAKPSVVEMPKSNSQIFLSFFRGGGWGFKIILQNNFFCFVFHKNIKRNLLQDHQKKYTLY